MTDLPYGFRQFTDTERVQGIILQEMTNILGGSTAEPVEHLRASRRAAERVVTELIGEADD